MNGLLQDLLNNIQSYYKGFVDLLPKLALAIIVFTVLLWFANFVKQFSSRRLAQRMDDTTLANFIAKLIGMVMVTGALLLVLRIVGLGDVAVGLLSTAGVGAFVIGFAFKDIGENFLAGIVLAFNRPFRIGDMVELGGIRGRVIVLNLRDTQIKTLDGKDASIPNSAIVKNPVINFTRDGFLRLEFIVKVAYEAGDLDTISEKVLDAIRTVPGVLKEEKSPSALLQDMVGSAVNLRFFFWTDTFDAEHPAARVGEQVLKNVMQA
ncbi:MAG: mechanosensitive ion channel domain-containing protein, partial [Bacteroidota bacterium]